MQNCRISLHLGIKQNMQHKLGCVGTSVSDCTGCFLYTAFVNYPAASADVGLKPSHTKAFAFLFARKLCNTPFIMIRNALLTSNGYLYVSGTLEVLHLEPHTHAGLASQANLLLGELTETQACHVGCLFNIEA